MNIKIFAKSVKGKIPKVQHFVRSVKKKEAKKQKIIRWFLGLLFLIPLLVFGSIQVIKILQIYLQPFPQAIGSFSRGTTWDSHSQINLLLGELDNLSQKSARVENLYLVEFNAENSRLRVLKIPVEVYVEVAYASQNEYQISNTYALGAIQDKKENMTLLKDTLEKNLALPIDRYLFVDSHWWDFFAENLSVKDESWRNESEFNQKFRSFFSITKNYFTGFNGFFRLLKLKERADGHFMTNLSSWEYFNFSQTVAQVNEEKATFSEIGGDFLDKSKDLEENDQSRFNVIKLDLFLQNNFYDFDISQERLRVKVLNGTGRPQIASHAARFVENLGAKMIETGNATETDTKIPIIQVGKSYEKSATVKKIQQIFGADIQIEEIPEIERTDIKLIIGLDWAEKMDGKEN